MIYLFDTSGVNRLYDDPDGTALITALKATNQIWVSSLNIVEAGCTADEERRNSLLCLLKKMTGDGSPLEVPTLLIRRYISAYFQRTPSANCSVGEETDSLWQILNAPDSVDEDQRRQLYAWHQELEKEFSLTHKNARPHFQSYFRGECSRPSRAADLIRVYMADEMLKHDVVNRIYRRGVGEDLPRSEVADLLLAVPELAGFLLAWAYSIQKRTVAIENYGRKNAGILDLWYAVYLPRIARFVTDDCEQYKALRFVAKAVAPGCEVIRYHSFRDRTVIGKKNNA